MDESCALQDIDKELEEAAQELADNFMPSFPGVLHSPDSDPYVWDP